MKHKGIPFTVVQTASPTGWKWTVQLDEWRTRTGTVDDRTSAIRLAQKAIDKAPKVKPSEPGQAASLLAGPRR